MRALIRLVLLSLLSLSVHADEPRDVTQTEVIKRIETQDQATVILDVRTPEEFAAGHLQGAINVPHDQIDTRAADLLKSKDKEVIVYCRSGRRTALAIDSLSKLGFTRLRHLDGDMNKWQQNKLPVQTSTAPVGKP